MLRGVEVVITIAICFLCATVSCEKGFRSEKLRKLGLLSYLDNGMPPTSNQLKIAETFNKSFWYLENSQNSNTLVGDSVVSLHPLGVVLALHRSSLFEFGDSASIYIDDVVVQRVSLQEQKVHVFVFSPPASASISVVIADIDLKMIEMSSAIAFDQSLVHPGSNTACQQSYANTSLNISHVCDGKDIRLNYDISAYPSRFQYVQFCANGSNIQVQKTAPNGIGTIALHSIPLPVPFSIQLVFVSSNHEDAVASSIIDVTCGQDTQSIVADVPGISIISPEPNTKIYRRKDTTNLAIKVAWTTSPPLSESMMYFDFFKACNTAVTSPSTSIILDHMLPGKHIIQIVHTETFISSNVTIELIDDYDGGVGPNDNKTEMQVDNLVEEYSHDYREHMVWLKRFQDTQSQVKGIGVVKIRNGCFHFAKHGIGALSEGYCAYNASVYYSDGFSYRRCTHERNRNELHEIEDSAMVLVRSFDWGFQHFLPDTLPELEELLPFLLEHPEIKLQIRPSALLEHFLPSHRIIASHEFNHPICAKNLYIPIRLPFIEISMKLPPESFLALNKRIKHSAELSQDDSLLAIYIGRPDAKLGRTVAREIDMVKEIKDFLSEKLPLVKYARFDGLASNLTLQQTRELFSKAVLVIGPHGGGIANIMFVDAARQPPPVIVEISNSKFDFSSLALGLKLRYFKLEGKKEWSDDGGKSSEIYLSPGQMKKYLEELHSLGMFDVHGNYHNHSAVDPVSDRNVVLQPYFDTSPCAGTVAIEMVPGCGERIHPKIKCTRQQ